MRDLAGREAEEAEDDVLDARLDEVLSVGDDLGRLLAEEPEDHREIVDAERPEGVLVRADHAEVLTVAVDAGNVPELTGIDELLHLAKAGVVEEQVAGHQHESLVRASATSSSISSPRIAGGFSTKTCLPASSACFARA